MLKSVRRPLDPAHAVVRAGRANRNRDAGKAGRRHTSSVNQPYPATGSSKTN
jgi:hypothetical protein